MYKRQETLSADSGHPYWANLLFLFNLSEALEKARGKYDPSKPPQIDYNFYVNEGIVSIIGRRRGSPMDKLVAELMIEANQQWGALLAEHEVPGLYRAQTGGRVFMTTKAEPHLGLGVAQYAWSTSPLRRAVDLICLLYTSFTLFKAAALFFAAHRKPEFNEVNAATHQVFFKFWRFTHKF